MRLAGGTILALCVACSSSDATNASSSTTPPETTDADAGSRPGDANDWTCLGHVVLPSLAAPSTVDFGLYTPVNALPVTTANVRACPDRGDASCANGVGPKTTDEKGRVVVDVPADFDGYWEATEPGDITALHFVPFRVWRTPDLQARVQWHYDDLRLLTDTIPGFAFDTAKGHVLIQARDCAFSGLPGKPLAMSSPPWSLAGGVTLKLDPMPPDVVVAYVELDPHARVRTDLDETQEGAGVAGFLNVPPGIYTVTGTRKSTGERVSTQKIHVRADAFSLLLVVPTP